MGCTCAPGWSGNSCTVASSATCATANTCVNGACNNIKSGGISCTCQAGSDRVFFKPFKNKSKEIILLNVIKKGWTGSMCQNQITSNYFQHEYSYTI